MQGGGGLARVGKWVSSCFWEVLQVKSRQPQQVFSPDNEAGELGCA